jgi:hypothetical protein
MLVLFFFLVHHHIGGLEKTSYILFLSLPVHHHIGGLEIEIRAGLSHLCGGERLKITSTSTLTFLSHLCGGELSMALLLALLHRWLRK